MTTIAPEITDLAKAKILEARNSQKEHEAKATSLQQQVQAARTSAAVFAQIAEEWEQALLRLTAPLATVGGHVAPDPTLTGTSPGADNLVAMNSGEAQA